MNDYTVENGVTNINGRPITDWGETATPFTHAPIDPKRALRRGMGGKGVKLGRKNPGRTVTLYLNPGSADSAFMQGLFNSGANISLGHTQLGTLEIVAATEGVVVNDAQTGRNGTTITDDQYIIEFNIWNETKGGI